MDHPPTELRPTSLRAKLAIVGLSVCGVQCLLSAGLLAWGATLNGDFQVAGEGSPVLQQWARLEELEVSFNTAWIVCFVTTTVLFCRWLYRSYQNMIVLQPRAPWGIGGLPFTPGGAVASFFIPVLNLWRPYQAVRELWDRSVPDEQTWQGAPVVVLWWSAWLGAEVLRRVGGHILRPSADADLLAPGLALSAASQLMWVAAAILAIGVVRGIERRQGIRIAALASLVPGRLAP